jgi:hypothetical protein
VNDRELLELAAKAAGFDSMDWLGGDDWLNVYYGKGKHSCWNPLTDDGDCARLEVACELQVDIGDVGVISELRGDAIECFERYSDHGDDRNKTRRRASVRAAAEIGAALTPN